MSQGHHEVSMSQGHHDVSMSQGHHDVSMSQGHHDAAQLHAVPVIADVSDCIACPKLHVSIPIHVMNQINNI